jgi:hypothetical protein
MGSYIESEDLGGVKESDGWVGDGLMRRKVVESGAGSWELKLGLE